MTDLRDTLLRFRFDEALVERLVSAALTKQLSASAAWSSLNCCWH